MNKLTGLLLLIWSIFCVLLFHWIGLLGEGFSYSATDLAFLKLGVAFWIGHGLHSSAIILIPTSYLLADSKRVGMCIMFGALGFDLVLVIGGRPITVIFAMVPITHALIALWLWRLQRSST